MGYPLRLGEVYRAQEEQHNQRGGLQQSTLFMWIATASGLVAALAAVIDRDTLNAKAWFGFAAAGALTASGTTDRSRGLAYLAIALLVAAVAILVGVFLTD